MHLLLPTHQDLDIERIPSYKASLNSSTVLSRSDEIIFMAQFYPPPKLAKLTLTES